MTKNDVEVKIENNKVTYKKFVDVPIELAFESWTTHEHLSQWWGPDGFTITTKSLNFSPGGIWDFVMHGPNGDNYNNRIQYLEIREPKFISYRHLGDGEGGKDVDFESKIFFESSGSGTKLTMEQIFPSREELERINNKYGAIEGAKQHIGNLADYLENI